MSPCGRQSEHLKTNGPERLVWPVSHPKIKEKASQNNKAIENGRGGAEKNNICGKIRGHHRHLEICRSFAVEVIAGRNLPTVS